MSFLGWPLSSSPPYSSELRNAKVSWQKKKSNKNADAKKRASPSRADEKAPKKKKARFVGYYCMFLS